MSPVGASATVRYWSNLFTCDMWTRRHPCKASWAATHHKTAAERSPGDVVIAQHRQDRMDRCVSHGIVRGVGPFGPFGDDYPLLADIEPIVELEPTEAMTIATCRTTRHCVDERAGRSTPT